MAELSPIPFSDLVRRMRREVTASQSIFDLPVKKWFVPEGELDFSAVHFGRRAATPVGPAAGPHTQLAQNIVLAWLAGSRILELKTVQVNDRLAIPRPCIHVPNVGFNVEWSQELRVAKSQLEYAKALYLIEILKATRAFGVFPGDGGGETIYDISVGYDLAGIRSPKVTGFLEALRRPRAMFDALRRELTGDLAEFRDLELPESISDCVTLSTFHGCPADEIESISRYLITQRGLHTIVKLNPTLLGFEAVRELLHDRLGYEHLELDRAAFDADLQYGDALAILDRLREVAAAHGTTIGAKFTNTLVVKNRADYFPTQSDPYMYLSGQPLHVISMTLMQRLRDDLGWELPTSFSAGIDARNFADAVACGMVPITTCTDLLRQGGYGRLPAYLRALAKEMRRLGVTSREAYVLAARGHAAEAARASVERLPGGIELWRREGAGLAAAAADELPRRLRGLAAAGHDGEALVLDATRTAGRLNGRDVVPGLAAEPRYHARANAKEPKRIDSRLALYDCINCDLCIAACPNDAIFAYEARPVTVATEVVRATGGELARAPGRGFTIAEAHQLAVAEGACNECSNCEVYCPEEGAPFVVKEQVFLGREAFDASRADGFYREDGVLYGRLAGHELELAPDPENNRAVLGVAGDGGELLRLELTWEPLAVVRGLDAAKGSGGAEIDTAIVWRMKTVWESIYHAPRPNAVQARTA